MNNDGNFFVKNSRFSYNISIDETTRVIVYNCSIITGIEGIVLRESRIIIEVPDGCMIALRVFSYWIDNL